MQKYEIIDKAELFKEIKSLEDTLEFIEDDELVEITPRYVGLKKSLLTEVARKHVGRKAKLK